MIQIEILILKLEIELILYDFHLKEWFIRNLAEFGEDQSCDWWTNKRKHNVNDSEGRNIFSMDMTCLNWIYYVGKMLSLK